VKEIKKFRKKMIPYKFHNLLKIKRNFLPTADELNQDQKDDSNIYNNISFNKKLIFEKPKKSF
jgi:hypothetical protein